jgi:hypothetical protein
MMVRPRPWGEKKPGILLNLGQMANSFVRIGWCINESDRCKGDDGRNRACVVVREGSVRSFGR